MAATIKTYGVTEFPETDEVPQGCERISLVTDDRTALELYQVEQSDGDFYLCDADGDKVTDVGSWTLQRVLADVPADDSDAFFEAIAATAKRADTMPLEEKVRVLSTFTNRDHAGRHFTECYSDDVLAALEAEGLIVIDRPVHEPTGIPYSLEYWTAEVTPAGVELVEANPEHWDTEA